MTEEELLRALRRLDKDYIVTISDVPDESEYFVGLCQQFPSLRWADKTGEAALQGIKKLVSLFVEDLRQAGQPVPEAPARKEVSDSELREFEQEIRRWVNNPVIKPSVFVNLKDCDFYNKQGGVCSL